MAKRIDFIDIKAQYATLKHKVDARIQTVLDHGQFILGPEVAEMEQRLAEFVGTRHCVSVSSGTDALLISLMALGVGAGDEIITTPFTFVSTAEVAALLGATPVFVDIEPDTYNMDCSQLEAAITNRTRAIIPVSLYGQPADMDEINTIATQHGITVIEDAAQSFGATYRGRQSCALSRIGCTSFFPSKPLGCYGDGGAIFTDDDELAQAMREIRVHGQERRYYYTRIGVGGRMDTIQCAVILAKLDRFEWELTQRALIAEHYIDLLKGEHDIGLPVVRPDRSCVWAQFTVQLNNRDVVAAELGRMGIPTAIHYPIPLHRQPAYTDICRAYTPLDQSEKVAARVLSLPMHPYLAPGTQKRIAETLKEAAITDPQAA
jgi:UDP-2-acetamido-2-deoxy-ribo-hexuluronate aminotransferase